MDQAGNMTVQSNGRPTGMDAIFLVFLAFILGSVVWVGYLSHLEGMKDETTKRNGEAWSQWMTEASIARAKAGFALTECAAVLGVALAPVTTDATPLIDRSDPEAMQHHPMVDAASDARTAAKEPAPMMAQAKPAENAHGSPAPGSASPRVWGGCLKTLVTGSGPLAALVNPFNGKPLEIATKCDMVDRSLAGALVLEKIVATPLGSAVPSAISPLVETDAIDQKMQLRITMCDKGAYPIRISELDF